MNKIYNLVREIYSFDFYEKNTMHGLKYARLIKEGMYSRVIKFGTENL